MSSIRENMREIKNNAELAEQKENILFQTIREKDECIEILIAQNESLAGNAEAAIQRATKADKREQSTVIRCSLTFAILLAVIAYLAFNQVY